MTELQKSTHDYAVAKEVWSMANKGKASRSFAARNINQKKPELVNQIRLAEAYLGRAHRV